MPAGLASIFIAVVVGNNVLPRRFRQLARCPLMTDSDVPPPLPSEQLLITTLKHAQFQRCVVVSPGRGQSGWHAGQLCPTGEVVLWYVDSFRAAQAKAAATQAGVHVAVVCSADLPPLPIQLALVPVLQRGEAEMTRDILQQAHERLEVGGTLVASVNNSRDHWLQQQMQDLFDKVKCRQTDGGWIYTATKQKPLKKTRDFSAEFVFRDEQRLVRMITRPSVFSHRSLDVAARLLIQHSDIQPGDRVLDYGCGCGAVAVASAFRSVTGHVLAVDCNARSIECAQRSATLNGVTNLTSILNHDGVLPTVSQYDLALLNPPYYGNFSIASHFMRVASEQVRDGGRTVVVTKNREPYHAENWPRLSLEREVETSGYQLLTFRNRRL